MRRQTVLPELPCGKIDLHAPHEWLLYNRRKAVCPGNLPEVPHT